MTTGRSVERTRPWPHPRREAVPALVTLGEFGPYSPEATVTSGLARLSAASYVIASARPHDVLPTPCVATVRNRWIDEPAPFTDNPCQETVRIRWG